MRGDICEIDVDRFAIVLSHETGSAPPDFPGYRVVKDSFVHSQTTHPTYGRVRELINRTNEIRLFIQHRPVMPGLAPFKITVVRNDKRRLSQRHVGQIVSALTSYRLLLLEIALDFPLENGVNADFVRRHAIFGKSRARNSRLFANTLRYGGRRSDKLVRCYVKGNLQCFRIELEIHSSLLRRHGLVRFEDLRKLPHLLCPTHIWFARLDWQAVVRHLDRRGVSANKMAELEFARSCPIHTALKVLRGTLGVKNAHRFLKPLAINRRLLLALHAWARNYRS
jgi:hypothetical protein